jgi:hypothetical protein
MRKKPDPKETKRDRFVRLASRRTNSVLNQLKILGNCSNKYVYDYTEEDVRKIFAEIDKRVRETKAKFRASLTKEFKLQ